MTSKTTKGQRPEPEAIGQIYSIPVSLLIIEDAQVPSTEFIRDVKERGILQPLHVRPSGKKYFVEIGRRRGIAARLSGLESVPCIIGEKLSASTLLAENNLRKPNPITDLRHITDLMLNQSLSEREIARQTGIPVATIRKRLKLNSLIDPLQEAMLELTESGKPRLTLALAERIAGHMAKAEQKKLVTILKQNGILTQRDYRDLRSAQSVAVTCDLFRDLHMEVNTGDNL